MSTYEFEHAYYIGNYMSGILYGIELVMYSTAMHRLLVSRRHRLLQGSRAFLAVYSSLLFVLVTIDVSTNAVWGEQMWITYRDRPGGVPTFIATQVSVWYETLSSTSVVAMIFLGDALLIYRLFVIYESNLSLIAIPCLAWCSAFALAIIQLAVAGKPGGDFFNGRTINFGTPYYALTIALNIVITTLICLRLFYFSRQIRNVMGEDGARTYTGLVAVLIESAAPYSLMGLMFLVPYAKQSGTAIAFGQVWAKMACLSPQLIILRVIYGTAWGKDTLYQTRTRTQVLGDNTPNVLLSTGLEFSPVESEHREKAMCELESGTRSGTDSNARSGASAGRFESKFGVVFGPNVSVGTNTDSSVSKESEKGVDGRDKIIEKAAVMV